MKLSIIIPVYNVEKYLKQCLDSVLVQIQEGIELIIVNDGSTDSSYNICKLYEEKYDFIRIINKKNEGVSKARNVALEKAKGEWVMFLDADDMLQKNSLVSLNKCEYDADIVICNYAKEHVDNKEREKSGNLLPKDLMMKGILNIPSYVNSIKEYNYSIDGISNWTCWGKLFKTQIIRDNNIMFPESITHGEDLIFCYQFYAHASKVYYDSTCLYYYRTNNQSVSRTFNSKRIVNTLGLFEALLKVDNMLLFNLDFQHFVVDRVIACCRLFFANEENTMTRDEKIKSLEEVCNNNVVREALVNCPLKKLSLGKKTNLLNIVILFLLKNKMYVQAIRVSKM